MLLDNVAIRSCVTPVRRATGDITTIEGLDHCDASSSSKKPGSPRRYRSAATAGPGRSWPRSRCSATGRIPTTRTSHSPWPADSAVTTRIRGSGKAIKRAAAARKAAMSPCGSARPGQPDSAFVMSAASRPEDDASPPGWSFAVLVRQTLARSPPSFISSHSNSPYHSRALTTSPASSPIRATSRSSRKKRTASCLPRQCRIAPGMTRTSSAARSPAPTVTIAASAPCSCNELSTRSATPRSAKYSLPPSAPGVLSIPAPRSTRR